MQAIIFDFDGLMLDTETPAYEAWSLIYKDFGVKLELNLWVACVGSGLAAFDPCTHLAQLIGKPVDRDALFQRKEQLKAARCKNLTLLPGIEDLINQARNHGLKIAVASSSSKVWVQGHLERLDILGYFSQVTTREDVSRIKPDPELYLKTANILGISPAKCLVFEDSLNGVRAAKAAGMACIAVPNQITAHLDLSEADRRLSSLSNFSLSDYFTLS